MHERDNCFEDVFVSFRERQTFLSAKSTATSVKGPWMTALPGGPHRPGDGGGAGPRGNGSVTALAPPHRNRKKREVVTAIVAVVSAVVKVAGQN